MGGQVGQQASREADMHKKINRTPRPTAQRVSWKRRDMGHGVTVAGMHTTP